MPSHDCIVFVHMLRDRQMIHCVLKEHMHSAHAVKNWLNNLCRNHRPPNLSS